MPDDVRYERAMRAVHEMLERIDCPICMLTPQELSQLVYAVLRAVYAVSGGYRTPRAIYP